MSEDVKIGRKPFGVEYLEPLQVSPRGRQVDGPAQGCCHTYNSEWSEYVAGSNGELIWTGMSFDNPSGGAFCDESDTCVG